MELIHNSIVEACKHFRLTPFDVVCIVYIIILLSETTFGFARQRPPSRKRDRTCHQEPNGTKTATQLTAREDIAGWTLNKEMVRLMDGWTGHK